MTARVQSWDAAKQRGLVALMKLAACYEQGTDRTDALREIERVALALAMLGSGVDPEMGPWDPDLSRQLDLALVARESGVRP